MAAEILRAAVIGGGLGGEQKPGMAGGDAGLQHLLDAAQQQQRHGEEVPPCDRAATLALLKARGAR